MFTGAYDLLQNKRFMYTEKQILNLHRYACCVLWSHGCHGVFVPANFMLYFTLSLLDPFPASPQSNHDSLIITFLLMNLESLELEIPGPRDYLV